MNIVVKIKTHGNPGTVTCKLFDCETKEMVLQKEIGIATNNIGEVVGIALAAKINGIETIYTTSKIAMTWIKKRTFKTCIYDKYPHFARQNERLSEYIDDAYMTLITTKCEIKLMTSEDRHRITYRPPHQQ